MLRDYGVLDATAQAKRIAKESPGDRQREAKGTIDPPPPRVPVSQSLDASRGRSNDRKRVKIDVRTRDAIRYGNSDLDLRGVAQLVDMSQTRAVGLSMHWASEHLMKDGATLATILDELDSLFDENGLDPLDPIAAPEHHPGNLARPRRYEIAAAINRLRSLRME